MAAVEDPTPVGFFAVTIDGDGMITVTKASTLHGTQHPLNTMWPIRRDEALELAVALFVIAS